MKDIIITISRQYGSGGRFIGERIAKKLNIGFYDKEFIDVVVEKTGISRETIEAKDEKFTNDNIFFNAFNKKHFLSPFNNDMTYSILDKIFDIQSEIIKDIADKGSCIMIGRCASFILKETHKCFNVFIHAPIENRIERITKQYGIKIENAETQLKNTDLYRYNYCKYYTGEEWGNMVNYNLTLDSGYFDDEEICNIIIKSVKEANKNNDKKIN